MLSYNLTYSWNNSSAVNFAGADWRTEEWNTWDFRWTYMPNNNVTFTFPVPAVAFYFFGLPAVDTNGNFAMCIDCSTGSSNFETVRSTKVYSGEIYSPPTVFYSKKFLNPETHTVTIWPMNGEITVEHFAIEVGAPSNTSATTTSTPHSPSSNQTRGGGVPIGAVIGAVLGGVCVLILACFLLYRCRRQKTSLKSIVPDEADAGAITTYIPYPQPYTNSSLGGDSTILVQGAIIPQVTYKGLPEL